MTRLSGLSDLFFRQSKGADQLLGFPVEAESHASTTGDVVANL